jgi:hypothetical protein
MVEKLCIDRVERKILSASAKKIQNKKDVMFERHNFKDKRSVEGINEMTIYR